MTHPKQQGVAMVVAMLILSIVTVFAASIAFDYQFSIRRVSNQMLMQQAYQYLLATESIASKALMQDLENDKEDERSVDHKGELWAEEGMVFNLEDGAYTGQLSDLQGRFNINSLRPPTLPEGQYPPQVPYTIAQGIFIRLLQALSDEQLSVSEQDAKAITEAVIDWLDEDSNPIGFQCGEDDAYRDIENRQAHRVANGPFYSVSELRLICNLPVALFQRLQPYVTVWPIAGQTSININTAGLPLLRSIFVEQADVEKLSTIDNKTSYQAPPPLAIEAVEKILLKTQAEELTEEMQQRSAYNYNESAFNPASFDGVMSDEKSEMGYTSLAQVSQDLDNINYWPKANLGLYSNWFLLQSKVSLDRLTQTMSSILSRENGSISIVARSTGGL